MGLSVAGWDDLSSTAAMRESGGMVLGFYTDQGFLHAILSPFDAIKIASAVLVNPYKCIHTHTQTHIEIFLLLK